MQLHSVLPLFTAALACQTPSILLDINTQPIGHSSSPAALTPYRGATYFTAESISLGRELFVTDGTSAGTHLFLDLQPGAAGSEPSELVTVGSYLFFVADDGVHGRELWRTDGTVAGTMVIDIDPGSSPSAPDSLVAFGGQLYFAATTAAAGRELWRSDGSLAGTTMLADLRASGSSSPTRLVVFGNELAFFATDDVAGRELWLSDGTSAGTRRVADIRPGTGAGVQTTFLCPCGNQLYFVGNDGIAGDELWVSDGTAANTHLVFDLRPGPESSSPIEAVSLHDLVLFTFDNSPWGELWRSDGTVSGTYFLARMERWLFGLEAGQIVATPNLAYFAGTDGVHPDDLWVTDGTTAGTRYVTETWQAFGGPRQFFAFGDRVLMCGDMGQFPELWISDGTPSGTLQLIDIQPGGTTPGDFAWDHTGTRVLFSGQTPNLGRELWTTDGTAAGTLFVANLDAPEPTADAVPSPMLVLENKLFFSAEDGIHGRELWVSDGTASNTRMLADIQPGPLGGLNLPPSQSRARVGSGIFFYADDGVHGYEPWFSDGTPAGTHLIVDLNPGAATSNSGACVEVGDLVYFLAREPGTGHELHVSDGTTAGTRVAFEFVPGPNSAPIYGLVAFGSQMVFVYDDGIHGFEPWISDGTAAGSRLLRDIEPGPTTSTPASFVVAGNRLYFTTTTIANGTELWVTDGTTPGTQLVLDIALNTRSSSPQMLTPTRSGGLYFTATDPVRGNQLWYTEGAASNTRPCTSNAVANVGRPSSIAELDGGVVFTWSIGATSMWYLDSASATGFSALVPTGRGRATAIGSRHAWIDREVSLWRTDGTPAGTAQIADLRFPATPDFQSIAGRLLFRAWHPDYGTELSVLDPGAVSRGFGRGCSADLHPPTLRADDPVLGRTMTVRGDNAWGTATLLVSLPPSGGSTYIDPCRVYLSLVGAATLATFTAQGAWELPVALPAIPALQGLGVVMQAVVGPTNAPLGADLSPAVELVFGS